MGGSGSTRWLAHSKKRTVEVCLSLDVSPLMLKGIVREGIHKIDGWLWLDALTGERTSSIGYEVDTTNLTHSWVRLFYTIQQTGEAINYRIQLVNTKPNFGGLRWWLICPLVVNGRVCNRRVGKIYLPPGGWYFGCRHCYDLTYRSSQESDKRVNWLRRNPETLMEIVRNRESADAPKLFLAMKALRSRFV